MTSVETDSNVYYNEINRLKNVKKHAQYMGVCACFVSFLIKIFAQMNLILFLCNRFEIEYLIITIKKTTIMSEIESKVKAIIVDKLGVDEADVKPEASFTNDLGADSLDTVELIMELEKEFGVTIPDSDAEKIQTVGDAIAYIENASK